MAQSKNKVDDGFLSKLPFFSKKAKELSILELAESLKAPKSPISVNTNVREKKINYNLPPLALTNEDEEFKENVDTLIESNILDLVFEFQKRGYVLTKDQQELFDRRIKSELLDLAEPSKTIMELVGKGYIPTDAILIFWLLENNVKYIMKEDNYPGRDFITTQFAHKWNDKLFVQKIINTLEKYLMSYQKELVENGFKKSDNKQEEVDFVHHTTKSSMYNNRIIKVIRGLFSKIEPHLEMTMYMHLLEIMRDTNTAQDHLLRKIALESLPNTPENQELKKLKAEDVKNEALPAEQQYKMKLNRQHFSYDEYCNIVKYMENQIKVGFTRDKENMLREIESANINNIIKDGIMKNTVTSIENLKLEKLPEGVLEMIDIINKQIDYCAREKELIEASKWQAVESLWVNKVPQVIQKYLNMPEEYKSKLKDKEGKSPEELMFNSLNNINSALNAIIKKANEERLKTLLVVNKYNIK